MEFIGPLRDAIMGMWIEFVKTVPLLAIALVVLALTWIVARVATGALRASLKRSRFRKSLQSLFETLLRTLIWSVGILIAITVVFPSLTPGRLLAALGLGSVAVGLAFKDIFENFFAGILIMLREPMRIGDFIYCDGVEGQVEKIALRETHLRQADEQLVLVPNSFLFKNPVHIRTDRALRRYDVTVGVAYGEDVEAAASVIHRAMENMTLVNQDRPVEVYAKEFNASSIDFAVRWWAESTPLDMYQSRNQVVSGIKRALDEAGIEIPFPYRTLTFKEPLHVARETSEQA